MANMIASNAYHLKERLATDNYLTGNLEENC